MTRKREEFSVAVVGGGAVGLATAIGLNRAGIDAILIGANPDPVDDGRTAALMTTSLASLDDLGVRPVLGPGHLLRAIRLIDITGALFRSPTVTFRSSEIGLPAFAENYSNAALVRTMTRMLGEAGGAMTPAPVAEAHFSGDEAQLVLADGQEIGAQLVVAADGARSLLRGSGGIGERSWAYEQVALTFHVRHSRDHEDVSTEFHTRAGPLTFVPFGDFKSSVVWLVTPAEAERLRALTPQALAAACQRRSSSLLGDLTIEGTVGAVPMRGLMATRATAPRLLLAGEALHVFPPIGAQGLNLGLRDAQAAVEAAKAGIATADAGSPAALNSYENSRRTDAAARTLAVDLLNRSLLSGLLPVDLMRMAGLSAAQRIAPLRHALMRTGMGQSPLAGLFSR